MGQNFCFNYVLIKNILATTKSKANKKLWRPTVPEFHPPGYGPE